MKSCYLIIVGTLFIVFSFAGLALTAPGAKEKPEAPATKEQKLKSQNNLKQLGLAIHNYHDTNGFLPTDVMKDGKAILSWRVKLLPYLEDDTLFREFNMDEPWDSETNKKLIDKIPAVFAEVRGKAEKSKTYYQMFAGENGLLKPEGKIQRLANITDGTSNTFMVVEADIPLIWTKPGDIPYDGKEIPKLGGLFGKGLVHLLFCDGSVGWLKGEVKAENMHRLINPSDGNPVDTNVSVERPGMIEDLEEKKGVKE